MANWTTINSGGGAGISVAAAPNVLGSTSVTVLYSCPGNDSMYQLQASIAIDLANGNIDHLKQIHIGNSLTGQAFTTNPVLRPATGWTSPVVITGDAQPRTGADQPGTLTFVCVNDLNDQTAGAVTKSFTVDASKVNSFASQGESGSRTCDINRVVYCTLSFVPVFNGPHYPENVSYAWFDGTSWTYYGWQKMLLAGQAFTISRPVPAATQPGWKFAARAGAFQWSGAITAQQLTDNGFLIHPSTFTVNGLAAPGASCVTNIAMGTIAARIDITNGWQWPEFSGVSWTDPTDVNTWLVKFYVREVDAAHSPAGDGSGQWREWIQKQVLGTAGGSARVSDPGPWPKGDALPITYRDTADTHHYLEVQCVAVNRLSTSPADWNGADTASSVAQGARGFLDFGVKPSGKIPLTMYDPMTQLPGVQVTDIPGPAVGSMALSCPISNGLTLASGQLTYCWDGTITNLPVDPTYAGCEITVKYGSGVEGGAFCTLRGGQSTFHNGDWARPNADVAVQFKAYPISRDGKRGTPAVYNTTLTAQASYNPPAPVGNMTITSSVSVNALPANAPTVTITGTVGFGSVTNYTGCDLTMLWDGETESSEGSLGPSDTLYLIKNQPQRASASGVIISCYPKNGNMRGTKISATRVAVAAAPQYPATPSGSMTITASVLGYDTSIPSAPTVIFGGTVSGAGVTGYGGCDLTLTWDGGVEVQVAHLGATDTTFRLSPWKQPGSASGVVITAYPTIFGVRGTGVAATRVATAAGSYPYTPAPANTGMSIAVSFIYGPATPSGVVQYGWAGSIVPGTDPNYNGCHLTAQWDFGGSENDVGDRGKADVDFHNGYWDQPATQRVVTIRAYPVNRDGVRGPSVSCALTIPAAQAYKPPTGGGALASIDFEDGTFGDWTYTGVGVFGIDTVAPISGTRSLKTGGGYSSYYTFNRLVRCNPGQSIASQCKYKSTAGATKLTFIVYFADANFGYLAAGDYNMAVLPASTTPATVSLGPYVAPAGAAYVQTMFQLDIGSVGNWWLDDISVTGVGGAGVIVHPVTGLPTASNLNPQSSILHDCGFNLTALGQLPVAGPIWRSFGNVTIRDDSDGLLHYCRITDDSANGSQFSQIVPILPLQIADLYFRTRNNNATAKLWITFAWLNRDYPDPPWVTYYQTTIAGNWAAWTSMPGILSVTAPAGARYLSFQMTVIEGTPSGQYFDIGDVQLRLH